MRIALGGMFRHSCWYLDRYFAQVHRLARAVKARGDDLRLIWAEGDSTDATWLRLAQFGDEYDTVLIKRAHGGPRWGSDDNPARWAALSWVCNGVLDHVSWDVDALVYVETDLIWRPESLLALVDQLDEAHPAIAPMCFTEDGPFYDIWGHIKGGVAFGPFPPYHHDLGPGLTQVDSAGSCIVMRGDVARCVRYGPDLVRGLGRSIYANGYSLWVDPRLEVIHPV